MWMILFAATDHKSALDKHRFQSANIFIGVSTVRTSKDKTTLHFQTVDQLYENIKFGQHF